jgi:hypothetical protein
MQGAAEYTRRTPKGFWIWRSKSREVRIANLGGVEKFWVKAARRWGGLAGLLNGCHLNLLGIGFSHLKYA